jgi:hypothetical protein
MLTIEYDSLTGIPVADGTCEQFVIDMICQGTTYFIAGSENIILATRTLIAEGVITHTDIQFKFKDKILCPNKDGRLDEYPTGFCDISEEWLKRLISYRHKKTS